MSLATLAAQPWVLSASTILTAGGFGYTAALVLLDPMAVPVLKGRRDAIDGALDRLLLPPRGTAIVTMQGWLAVIGIALAVCWQQPGCLLPAVAAVGLPTPILRHAIRRRRTGIEAQLDGWLTGLANALRAAPALGDGIASTLPLVHTGLRAELRLVLRKAQLGTPIETGLSEMAKRIDSPTVSAAVMTLRIAARSGGNLGATLDTTAAALREMARLEGILQTQTAGGKTQALMVSAIPLPLIALLHYIDPSYLAPMWSTTLGRALVALAAALWLVAGVWARKIVQVDL